MAAKTGISKSAVQRYVALFGVQPHRTTGFVLLTDPFFVGQVRDVGGLYLNPPDRALVLFVDEKSQIQALERTQSNRPLGLGYVEGITHLCMNTQIPALSEQANSRTRVSLGWGVRHLLRLGGTTRNPRSGGQEAPRALGAGSCTRRGAAPARDAAAGRGLPS